MDFANIKLPIAVIGIIVVQAFGKTQAVITNEMRSIMADHTGFADVLRDMGQAGALPSGERRAYGGY